MPEFKHIRTSIFPCGYKDGFYKFSLCIDLNPNYDNDNFDKDRAPLMAFIKKYGIGNDSVFSILTNVIPGLPFMVNSSGQPIQISGMNELCNKNEIIAHVPELWTKFLATLPSFSTNSRMPKFTQPLNIQHDVMLSAIGDVNGNLPDPNKTRSEAIAAFGQLNKSNSKTKHAEYMGSLGKAMEALNPKITEFATKLEGINAFAAGQNKVEFEKLESLQNVHAHIFDSVDAMLEVWSFIDSNNLLQRLMGKTIDFMVHEDSMPNFAEGEEFSLKFGATVKIDGLEQLKWENLSTPVRIYKKHKLIVVVDPGEPIELKLEHTNYDIGGKLIGLKAIQEKYKDYQAQLDDPTVSESKKYALRKQIISLESSALTIGVNTYNKLLTKMLEWERNVDKEYITKYKTDGTPPKNYLYRIRRGYRFSAIDGESGALSPLGQRKCTLRIDGAERPLPEEFSIDELAITSSSGSHAIMQGADTNGNTIVTENVIQDEAMLNWSGLNIGMPSIFSNHEDETNFETQANEGATSDSTRIVSDTISKFYLEDFLLKGVEYSTKGAPEATKHVHIEYSQDNVKNKKLLFGNEYGMVLTPEYKNGWAIPTETLQKLVLLDKSTFPDYHSCVIKTIPFIFKRNEPIKPVEFFLSTPLTDRHGKPTLYHDGETLYHLVIRNWPSEGDTKQQCVRYVLPPAISFQQAFWYNKIFEMTPEDSFLWYKKYNFPKAIGQARRDDKFKIVGIDKYDERNPADVDEVIAGSTLMRDYYDNPGIDEKVFKGDIINYLPEPLCKGFRLEFYLDKYRTIKASEYLEYEKLEFYFSGKYPKINAWKIVIRDFDGNPDLVRSDDDRVFIRVEKGKELFVTARTILDEKYESYFETFGNYNDYTRYGNNDLLTPPMNFEIVHAVQRPLVRPKINNILDSEKEFGKTTYTLKTNTDLEQTGIYRDEKGVTNYVEESIPSGSVELYAKWEEYIDDPDHIFTDETTPNDPVNKVDLDSFGNRPDQSQAVFEGEAKLSEQLPEMEKTLSRKSRDTNDFKNYSCSLTFKADARSTKFIEKYFWVKNKSKFTAYFPKENGIEDNQDEDSFASREYFNRTSAASFMVKILNSKKPEVPMLAEKSITLVSVNEEYKKSNAIYRKSSMNRLRFFFKRGRLTSGKGERIGFVVNEPDSLYNDYLVKNDLISVVGRDVLSDSAMPYDGMYRNKGVLLTQSNFVTHDPDNISDWDTNSKEGDIESFYPEYVKELGLMTYLPKFDRRLNLWYLDIEIDVNDNNGKELHSPFLRFSIVHYQKFSHNYNLPKEADLSKDCRLSTVSKSGYVYILPTRNIKLEFGRTEGRYYVKPKITYDKTSVKGNPEKSDSKFYLVVRKKEGAIWKIARKAEGSEVDAFYNLSNIKKNTELYFAPSSGTAYQIVILESEDWGNVSDDTYHGLMENHKSRIVHVNTFEIDSNNI